MISLLLIICCLASIILGLLVLLRDSKKVANILFSGIAVCFAVWIAAILLFLHTNQPDHALFFAKVFYGSAIVFPALLLLFAMVYPKHKPLNKVIIASVVAGSLAVFLPLLISPDYIVSSIVISDTGNHGVIEQVSYLYFSFYFVLYFFIAMVIAFRKFFKYKDNRRMQAGLYAAGILFNSIPGYYTNLYLPYYGDYSLIWVGPVASVFFLGMTMYGIVRHKMFDIRLVLARVAAYTIVLLIMAAIYGSLLVGLSQVLLLGVSHPNASFFVNLFIALFLAFTYPHLKEFFNKATDKVFFQDTYNLQNALNYLSDIAVEEIKLEKIFDRFKTLVYSTLKPKSVYTIILNAEGALVYEDTQKGDVEKTIRNLNRLTNDKAVVYRDDYLYDEDSDEIEIFDQMNVAVVCRLQTSTQDLGFISIADKKSGDMYRRDDKHLIQALRDEMSVAVQNAIRFGEVQSFNKTLERKIAEATSQLQKSNQKLRALDETKDEFISMASHQLRTPLTSIKGYISMLLDGDMGEVKPAQRRALEEAYGSSQRMVYLIGDFLNLSRIKTGKFIIDRNPVALTDIIEQEISQLKSIAKVKGIDIKYSSPKDIPVLSIDETKIRQVMMNFIDNAIHYSKADEGGKVEIKLTGEADRVKFEVVDSGIGVPESDKNKLFTKFFRADNARRQRPDGTGIGLYMAKKVIVSHGGKIVFESQEEVGSTFGFELPLDEVNLGKQTDDTADNKDDKQNN